jgi:hypothetical protein
VKQGLHDRTMLHMLLRGSQLPAAAVQAPQSPLHGLQNMLSSKGQGSWKLYHLRTLSLSPQASPRPFHQIRKVLEQEVGPAAVTLFSHFEEQATAAASLAQVRRCIRFL